MASKDDSDSQDLLTIGHLGYAFKIYGEGAWKLETHLDHILYVLLSLFDVSAAFDTVNFVSHLTGFCFAWAHGLYTLWVDSYCFAAGFHSRLLLYILYSVLKILSQLCIDRQSGIWSFCCCAMVYGGTWDLDIVQASAPQCIQNASCMARQWSTEKNRLSVVNNTLCRF